MLSYANAGLLQQLQPPGDNTGKTLKNCCYLVLMDLVLTCIFTGDCEFSTSLSGFIAPVLLSSVFTFQTLQDDAVCCRFNICLFVYYN